MSLIQALPCGPLDIVGDVHGEYPALLALLGHLGYDLQGGHPQGRHLVFVGDLIDRGPDSPAVLALIQRLVEAGHAQAVLGNHEINLLRHDPKDGAGWFFEPRRISDEFKYAPFALARDAQHKAEITQFLHRLPLALERADLRVVHAAWHAADIARVRQMPAGSACAQYDFWEQEAANRAERSQLAQRLADEAGRWPHSLENPAMRPPFLQAHCDSELNKALVNPLKVLTCGLEQQTASPFFAGNKWRFVERLAWWDSYTEATPVIVGHFWRSTLPGGGLFAQIPPLAWHGARRNVFCVDYSVGARAQARTEGRPGGHLQLAAMRWPERQVMFDDGRIEASLGFAQV